MYSWVEDAKSWPQLEKISFPVTHSRLERKIGRANVVSKDRGSEVIFTNTSIIEKLLLE